MIALNQILKAIAPLWQMLYQAKVIKDFFVYAFGSLILRAFSLFILPFIMRIFTPADYGALSLATAFITIGSTIIGLGLRQFLSIEYFHHDHEGRQKIVNEIIIAYTMIAAPVFLVCWLLKKSIINHVFFNALSPLTLLPALLSLFFFFYVELLYQLLQYKRLAKLLTALQISIALITACNTFYFVWFLKMKIAGVLWAQCTGHLCAMIISIYLYVHSGYLEQLNFHSAFHKSLDHLKQGLPFVPGVLSSWILASSDRWMLGYYRSISDVGIYAVADLFAQLFNFVILVPWAGSYLPYILQRYKKHEPDITPVDRENKKIMWISMISLCILLMTIPILKPILRFILPPNYHESISYIWILLLGQIFLLGSYFSSTLIQYRKQSLFMALSLLVPATTNIVLNCILVQPFGIIGCAWATCISYAIYFCILAHYNHHHSDL